MTMSSKNEVNLTESELKLFESIEKNDLVTLKTVLADKQNVNILDENSMTPLQHAAYKGNKDMVQILIDQGANVNLCEHQHNYTALHFAGLSGNIDVCSALLLAGAKSNVTNTVGRTPSQMAAFVGHHKCVAVINNYVPKSFIEYYIQNKPTLPKFLDESFHKFVMQVNVHPVKIALNLQNYVGLLDHLQEIKAVLVHMSEREMKKGNESNEVMSFKFHYLSYIVGEINKIRQRQATSKKEDTEDDKKLDVTELFTRKLLKPSKDNALEYMDSFLRECIREFPFRECTLFRQMVASLTSSKEAPPALSVISSAINGQRGFIDNIALCNTCGEEKPAKKCSKCKVVQYCDRNCQRLHWHWHKKACSRLSQMGSEPEADKNISVDPDIATEINNLLVSDEVCVSSN